MENQPQTNWDPSKKEETTPAQNQNQGEKKEEKDKNKLYLVIAICILGIAAFLGALYWFVLKEPEDTDTVTTADSTQEQTEDTDEDQDSEDTSEDTDDQGETEDMYFDYVWYEDDYIKFMYPEGWSASFEKDPDQYHEETITIQSGDDLNTSENKIMFTTAAGGGGCTYTYNPQEPLVLATGEPGLCNDIQLTNEPIIQELAEEGFFYFAYTDRGIGTAASYDNEVYSVGEWVAPSATLNFIQADHGEQFIIIDTKVENQDDFDKYMEVLGVFFGTIERLDGKSETSENPYEGWETYTHDGAGITFMYPESWSVSQRDYGQEGYEITIVKDDNYSILLTIPSAHGPEPCFFTDSQPPDTETDYTPTIYEEYTEFEDEDSLYRRVFQSEYDKFRVCTYDVDGMDWTDWNGKTYIRYLVPGSDYDGSIIETMDLITLSIE